MVRTASPVAETSKNTEVEESLVTCKQKMYALNPLSIIAFPLSLAFTASAMALDANEPDYDLKLLGKYVFFDTISNPKRMACVTCHDPNTGGEYAVSKWRLAVLPRYTVHSD